MITKPHTVGTGLNKSHRKHTYNNTDQESEYLLHWGGNRASDGSSAHGRHKLVSVFSHRVLFPAAGHTRRAKQLEKMITYIMNIDWIRLFVVCSAKVPFANNLSHGRCCSWRRKNETKGMVDNVENGLCKQKTINGSSGYRIKYMYMYTAKR